MTKVYPNVHDTYVPKNFTVTHFTSPHNTSVHSTSLHFTSRHLFTLNPQWKQLTPWNYVYCLVVFFLRTPCGKRGSDDSGKSTASIFTVLSLTCSLSVLGTHLHWLGTTPICLSPTATVEQHFSKFSTHTYEHTEDHHIHNNRPRQPHN
jgi:hypothetical protein